MNREDYVSLEVAELLEASNCDLSSDKCYIGGRYTDSSFSEDADDIVISAPTLYEVQKWLRNKKGVLVEVNCMLKDYYTYDILTISNHDLEGLSYRKPCGYKTYEEALNAGILTTLKLLWAIW